MSGPTDLGVFKPFLYLLRFSIGCILKLKYNIHTRNAQQIMNLKPPYLVLSNHFNTFDPFIISTVMPEHIHWVASDVLFRNRYLRFLMKRLVGSISKSKSKSDFYTIRQIADTVKQNGVVGIFPEGQRSWDGRTLPLMFATAKLVRMLKVPVVFCILEGGYHSLPRWSKNRRKGKLTVVFQEPWYPEEFAGMTTDEVFAQLSSRLSYDDYEQQSRHRVLYRSNRRAEYLEHVLFVCPSCLSLASLTSRGNVCRCGSCDLAAEVDVYGFFTFPGKEVHFRSVTQWNQWQRDYLKDQFLCGRWGEETQLFADREVRHYTGYRDRRMKYEGRASIGFTPRGFLISHGPEQTLYAFEEIDSLALALQSNLEFYLKDTLHRFQFPGPRISAYKYLSAYECLTEVRGMEDRHIDGLAAASDSAVAERG